MRDLKGGQFDNYVESLFYPYIEWPLFPDLRSQPHRLPAIFLPAIPVPR